MLLTLLLMPSCFNQDGQKNKGKKRVLIGPHLGWLINWHQKRLGFWGGEWFNLLSFYWNFQDLIGSSWNQTCFNSGSFWSRAGSFRRLFRCFLVVSVYLTLFQSPGRPRWMGPIWGWSLCVRTSLLQGSPWEVLQGDHLQTPAGAELLPTNDFYL